MEEVLVNVDVSFKSGAQLSLRSYTEMHCQKINYLLYWDTEGLGAPHSECFCGFAYRPKFGIKKIMFHLERNYFFFN